MEKYEITPVGYVKNEFDEPVSHHEIKKQESVIEIFDKYAAALLNIDRCPYLDIVFYFHKSTEQPLSGKIHSGEERGVFASRSPKRPNLIGITTVKVIKRKGNSLCVEGLDAINNTPVIDIKCCDTSILEMENGNNEIHTSILKSNPRLEIQNLIVKNDLDQLFLKAGQLHGHFCPGLAMGVMAAAFAMNRLNAESDGMEDLLAVTETNNCFSDGVQFVTGCSFGNNSLIFKDIGKTAFTLAKRDGKGVRICSKHESQEVIRKKNPAFNELYQKVVVNKNHDPENIAKYKATAVERAFKTLQIPFDLLFAVNNKNITLPDYAGICESVVCKCCGESVMETRTLPEQDGHYCLECSKTERENR